MQAEYDPIGRRWFCGSFVIKFDLVYRAYSNDWAEDDHRGTELGPFSSIEEAEQAIEDHERAVA